MGSYGLLACAGLLALFVAQPARAEELKSSPATTTFTLVPVDVGSVQTGTEKKPEPLEPQFVRPFVKIESGRNDGNPTWSPSGRFLSFERSIGDKKEIHIALADGTDFQTVYHLLAGNDKGMKFFFPGVVEDISYNAGITWSPDEYRFLFMSNGGEGNYDLYLGDLGGASVTRLTDHREKDGQADWSPNADRVVFVSGRTGKGDIYVMELSSRALTRVTLGGTAGMDKEYFYPQWSPDGKKIAMMAGSNENHDIMVIEDVSRGGASQQALTTWLADDLRPKWSPDGKRIAFYSNCNAGGDPGIWSIVVVSANGADPAEGEGLSAKVVATDVIPDVERGPAWHPDSSRIVYVKNDRQEYNPLYSVDIRDRSTFPIRTDTRMNHDVAISTGGTIAFRAQVDQWDQIFVMKLKN